MNRNVFTQFLFSILASLPLVSPILAADYPAKPVTIIIGYAAGGTVDLPARALAAEMGQIWGKPIVIENRPGAGESLVMNQLVRAEPDGHTLMFTTSSLTTSPAFVKAFTFDLAKDIAPITYTAIGISANIVQAKSSIRSVDDLIAEMKRNPGKLNCSASQGSFAQMQGSVFKTVTGTDFTLVPYTDGSGAAQAVAAEQIDCMMTAPLGLAKSLEDAGKVRVLYVTGTKRSDRFPNVPSLSENPSPTVQILSKSMLFSPFWFGLIAPAKTSPAVINSVYAAAQESIKRPEYIRRTREIGYSAPDTPPTPQEFQTVILNGAAEIRRLATQLKIEPR